MKFPENFWAGAPEFMMKRQFWVAAGVVSVACVIIGAANGFYDAPVKENQPSNESQAIINVKNAEEQAEKEKAEKERKQATEAAAKLEAEKKADEEKQKAEAEKKRLAEEEAQRAAAAAAAAQSYSQQPATSSATTAEDSSLPLKAICKDGSISYQDTPSLPDYRGMCSKHGGIKQKLGRVR